MPIMTIWKIYQKNNAWDDWIEFFLEAIIFQAQSQSSLAKQVIKLYEEMKMSIAEITRSHFVIKILDFIFSHPIFKGTGFVNATSIPKATASRLLNVLVEGGILIPVREKTGRAGQIYRFERLLKIFMSSDGSASNSKISSKVAWVPSIRDERTASWVIIGASNSSGFGIVCRIPSNRAKWLLA